MKYIWINPVTSNMYVQDDLNHFLQQQGYIRIETRENHSEIVKEKYKRITAESRETVLDMRCPAVLPLIESCHLSSPVITPAIEPILIHCGREMSSRKDLRGFEKIITTPCHALADMGNALGLPETRFIPWNCFLDSIGSSPPPIPLDQSPIPPGFFSDLGIRFFSVTGEEAIMEYLENYKPKEAELVELLFCKDGCHNGDGIKMMRRNG